MSLDAVNAAISSSDAVQVTLLEEKVLTLNDQDEIIGTATKKESHAWTVIEKDGMLHRAFSLFLFSPDNKLLLQKRAAEKITFPSLWTNSVCSHPLAGIGEEDGAEGVKKAAVRKAEHELGIADPAALSEKDMTFLTRMHYKASNGDGIWGEHEIDYILIARSEVKLNPSANEVSDVKYVTQDELRAILADPSAVTPWFKLICEAWLFTWWDALIADKLESCADRDTIHRL
uniref:isopentenyl-diphosphate Delta-isomerase n=1 Tax=Sexangularia sp. CB-2014 TaxID=1486929 RepID=A0A7S1V8D9_9EUKA